MLGRELAQPLEEARLRRHDADVELDRLDDDRRDLAPMPFEDALHDLRLVERRHHGLGDPAARDPGAGWDAVRGIHIADQIARWLDADQHVVVVPVVAAFELDDLLAAGEAARHPDGVHRRLGARVAEADLVGSEATLQLLRHEDLILDREGEGGADRRASLDRLDEGGVRVAGGQHPERHVEVEVLVAVGVPHPGAAALADEERVRVVGLERAGDAERHRLASAGVELGAARGARTVGCLFALDDRLDAGAIDLTTFHDGQISLLGDRC